jgi:hypothetical protein
MKQIEQGATADGGCALSQSMIVPQTLNLIL